jgi:hypothetical protein
MPSKSKLVEAVAGVSWEAHPSCLILLAKKVMLGLEKVQYRALRIALGLMGSTPNN